MTAQTRRWCRTCRAVTPHRGERSPEIRDQRFILIQLAIMLVWGVAVPWVCDECHTSSWLWSRRKG